MRYFQFFLAILLFSSSAFGRRESERPDKEIIESSKCATYFRSVERAYSIPKDLLHSISLQESGRKHSISGKKIPWPWSVNIEGKGFYFNTKSEAVHFVRQQRAFGKRSIDVGCMQINLLHHPEAFDSINDAIEPKHNINYGAKFLRAKYEQYGSWKKAIANYHSANEELGSNYHKSIVKIVSNIDKYKFDHLIKRTNVNYSSKSIVSGNKMNRYRSNMMIYVPKNSNKRMK